MQSNALAGALGHLYELSAAIQTHHLQQQDFQLIGIEAERRHRCFHSSDITVMIRAPNVDERPEPALEFILMIGDIGGKIRRLTVFSNDYAILVVAVRRRFEPKRPVLFIDRALRL